MHAFRRDRNPTQRQTILIDTQDFTDEPGSLPHTPPQTLHFLRAAPPGLRRATEPAEHHGSLEMYPSPSSAPYYANGISDPQLATQQRKWTQEDQDHYDEKARKKAMNELVQSWMDRLQLISVITTFFAAMEAQLLGSTVPNDPKNDPTIDQAANAALAGALVVHVFAAIISFLAAFFLIRYKLTVARREERKIERGRHNANVNALNGVDTPSTSSVWSSNPHLEQVGPFRRGQPPTHLLDHCHSLSMWLAAIGFVLALVGVMCFVWSRLAFSSGVFASVCVGACVVSSVGAIFWPASSVHKIKNA